MLVMAGSLAYARAYAHLDRSPRVVGKTSTPRPATALTEVWSGAGRVLIPP
ncbi:hypothetical protein DC74_p00016 (plasmid) [Streptomyces noursei]|nr:hypothetical protein DC74_p00016 [Streptomyces noursei]